MEVPCGRCLGCLLARGRDWTVRCLHESRFHDFSWFVTLTYSDDQLHQYLSHPSLNPPDMQRFFKRLRKAGHKVRYLYCGEYGEQTERPHYHAIIFGLTFTDLKPYTTRNGNQLYTSAKLEAIWSHGNVVIGALTPETVAYTCGYTVKKLYGPDATTFYASRGTYPPYISMSRKPGIGTGFVSDNLEFIAGNDFVYMTPTFKTKVPRFYDKILKRKFSRNPLYSTEDPSHRADKRMHEALKHRDNSTADRLLVRHAVALARYHQRPTSHF